MFWLGKKQEKAWNPELSNFESFREAITMLKNAGWSDEQINTFIRMSHRKITEEQEMQREYEASLTPEQRAQDTDYYTTRVANTLQDGGEWQPEISEYSLTKEEIIVRAKNCTKTLISVFDRLKKENPLESSLDLYKDNEAREAITKTIEWLWWNQANAVFKEIDNFLHKQWLRAHSRPAMAYFREESKQSGARFEVEVIGPDTLKISTLEKMAQKAVDQIEELYNELKTNDVKKNWEFAETRFNLYKNAKGKEIITSAVNWLRWGAELMLKNINTKLRERWIEIKSRSSISYFTEKSKSAGIQFEVWPVETIESKI